MSLIRYQPLRYASGMSQLHNEINRLFDSFGPENDSTPAVDWTPAVDVNEEENRYVLHADVPGVDPQEIEVTLEDGVLTIRGERRSEKNVDEKGFRRIERFSGSFYRRFTLPDTADADNISATTKNGVLELVIPKQEKVQPRRITVKG
jgi:HSP20 family protein